MSSRSPTRRGRLAILGAALAWSTAGIGQRELDVSPITQVAGRALFAMIALLALVLVTERTRTVAAFRSIGWFGLLSAVLLAISSGTFFLALNYTTVANVLFMQAAAPFFAALLGWWLLGDRVARRTWWAMALAAVGVAMMAIGSLDAGWSAVVLPLVVTGAFAGVIVITRHRRDISMMPATCTSQVIVVVVCAPFASFASAGASDWVILGALGVGQMAFGLALLTIGARSDPSGGGRSDQPARGRARPAARLARLLRAAGDGDPDRRGRRDSGGARAGDGGAPRLQGPEHVRCARRGSSMTTPSC